MKSSNELDEVLPKADCMVMGSVFTHLSLAKMKEILDKTLPFYDNGFQLGFTAFLADAFLFVRNGVYGPETYAYSILDINWFEDYCAKNDLTLTLHPYKQDLVGFVIETEVGELNHQSFLTISKKK